MQLANKPKASLRRPAKAQPGEGKDKGPKVRPLIVQMIAHQMQALLTQRKLLTSGEGEAALNPEKAKPGQ